MGEFPLPRIKDFIRRVVPFDTLGEQELSAVVARMEIAYFPRNEVIIRAGGPPAADLAIIQSGSVKVALPDDTGGEILIDIRGEGDTFGAVSLLQGIQALFDVTAREDVIAFLLPAAYLKDLVERKPAFNRHFSFSLARNLQAVRRTPAACFSATGGGEALGLDAQLARSQVGELMTTHLLTCPPDISVREAARLMTRRRVGSVVVAAAQGPCLGILTDTDLRARVLAGGADPEAPVSEVMSKPVRTIHPKAFAFEAMLEMIRHRIHHLVVSEGATPLGVVSDHDLRVVTGAAPVGVVRDLDKIHSVDELELVHHKLDPVLEMLLRLGGSAQYMLDLASEFNDRLAIKVLELTELEMADQDLGRAPVEYGWLALGSAGRREQALRTCQMNALIYADPEPDRAGAVGAWFLELGVRTVERLTQAGFPQCPDGLMASQAAWCQDRSGWSRTFLDLICERDQCVMPQAGPLFDLRGMHGRTDFAAQLRQQVRREVETNRPFVARLARLLPYEQPPLGFLREFVVDKSGEYQNRLDLKMRGLSPLVHAVRVLALEQGLLATGTLERLEGLARRAVVSERFAGDLREAFSFITLLRIARHLEARAAGLEPDSFVVPASLSPVQRKMLKDSFAVINELQELLASRYQDQMVA
ncbi:MAG: putative nucleotidyltransferase substrate binding domain-containing protein [Pseudomonadota bacterium]